MATAPQTSGASPTASGFSGSLLEICQAISSELELQPLLEMILDIATRELHANRGSVLLIDRSSDELRMLATKGMPREVVERGYIPRRGSVAEWVIEHAEPVILNDRVEKDERFSSLDEERSHRSSMCVPLQAQGRVIGTLNITRDGATPYGETDQEFAQMLASQAAVAIENARLHGELLQATRLATVGQTISGISHCIKNMLTGVKGGIAITELSFKEDDADLRDRGFEMLKRNINRISMLVLDMLDFSKSRRPMRNPVDPHLIVSDVVDTVFSRAEEAEVEIVRDLPEDLPKINVDHDQIFRCLLNVVGNAIDASPAGSRVTIRGIHLCPRETAYRMFDTDGEHDYFVLDVVDEGCGIPEHLIAKIFDPFYSTKGSKGTGLGMPVTKKIIDEHGGRISIDSHPGAGTTIRFILPMLSDEEVKREEG